MNFGQTIKITALLAAVAVSRASAAGLGDWTSVRTLRPGDRVGVVRTGQLRSEGKLVSTSDGNLVLDSGGRWITVERGDVLRVYTAGMSRKKRALIGAAAGLAAGGGVAAGVSKRLNNEGFFSGPAGAAGTAAAIAGGTGIGAAAAAFTGNGYHTIYRIEQGR